MSESISPDAVTAGALAVDYTHPDTQPGMKASSPQNFCPHGGLVGSEERQWNARTGALLHRRLRALGTLIVVAEGLFVSRDLFVDTGVSMTASYLFFGLIALMTGYLWWEKNPPLIKLRALEVLMFLLPIAGILYADRMLIYQAAVAGDAGLALANWFRLLIHMGLMIFAYAMFIPAGWKRTLASTLPMALAPFAVGAVMIGNLPEVAAAAQQVLSSELWTAALVMMGAFVAMAVYGTHVIDSYRHQGAEAGYAGQYHLEEKIGSGGMGEVWLARHNLLSRRAAIKVIRPEILGGNGGSGGVSTKGVGTAIQRFEREAQATASLTSPHTIQLYDFGTARDGSFYYVMEHLDGLDFGTLVDDHGPVPVQRAVHLLIQACESLADAHEHGLIHRDIKPANIFATQMGITHDFVKVLDFGLVKETEPNEAATRLTQEGMTSGTPAFMPPEIALAKPDVDGRADIYALGAVGYWLSTGQCVFESDSPVQMVVDHVNTDPPAPSSRTDLPIPPQFDDVILRTLVKDPAGRFQSMREFADALGEIPLSSNWSNRDAEDWWRRHPGNGGGG